MQIIRSLAIFILAGSFEIGSGYFIWLWLKEGKPLWYGAAGVAILALYDVVATWQTADLEEFTQPMAASLSRWH